MGKLSHAALKKKLLSDLNLLAAYDELAEKHTLINKKINTSILKKPTNEKEYKALEALLDKLIDQVGSDEDHPLAAVMEIIGINLEAYDDEHHPALK